MCLQEEEGGAFPAVQAHGSAHRAMPAAVARRSGRPHETVCSDCSVGCKGQGACSGVKLLIWVYHDSYIWNSMILLKHSFFSSINQDIEFFIILIWFCQGDFLAML